MVNCKVKASDYRLGEAIGNPSNRAVLVCVDGAWRFIDQHWGSCSISVAPDAEWQMAQDGGGIKVNSLHVT